MPQLRIRYREAAGQAPVAPWHSAKSFVKNRDESVCVGRRLFNRDKRWPVVEEHALQAPGAPLPVAQIRAWTTVDVGQRRGSGDMFRIAGPQLVGPITTCAMLSDGGGPSSVSQGR